MGAVCSRVCTVVAPSEGLPQDGKKGLTGNEEGEVALFGLVMYIDINGAPCNFGKCYFLSPPPAKIFTALFCTIILILTCQLHSLGDFEHQPTTACLKRSSRTGCVCSGTQGIKGSLRFATNGVSRKTGSRTAAIQRSRSRVSRIETETN